jgi:uncharacterized membrane-anchored protein YjiN (DUF445 family)
MAKRKDQVKQFIDELKPEATKIILKSIVDESDVVEDSLYKMMSDLESNLIKERHPGFNLPGVITV